MKTKAILFDADGIMLSKISFSDLLAREHEVDAERLKSFFSTTFNEIKTGKKDLKIELEGIIDDVNWQGSVDDLLEIWNTKCTIPNEQMIEQIKSLTSQGYICALASNQEKYRGEYIEEELKFANYFSHIFYSHNIEVTKDDKKFFENVLEVLKIHGIRSFSEIMFFDDDEENIYVAKNLGIKAHHVESPEECISLIEKLI